MGKKVPNKNRTITVNLFHDGVFTVCPFEYAVLDIKQITDIQFEGMSYVQFRDVIRKLVYGLVASMCYCKVGTPLRIGIKPIQNDSDVDQFVNFAYKNKWQINLYVEHSGYDVLDIRDQRETMADDGNKSSDAYYSSDEKDLSYVDFHSELDHNVVINTVSTNDPFLNKLCGDNPEFINLVDEPVNENVETVEEDTENIDPVFNVKERISYVTHDPNQDWKKMEPILGMRFHHPEQLKLCLANYGVANGYPLWFYRNDWRKFLVYCGRDVESVSTRSRSKSGEGTSKSPKTPVKAITSGEGTSKSPKTPVKAVNSGEACSESPKWTKSKVKIDRKKPVCGFRLYASWMSTEHSFQIKSLKPEHNCSRNYNLGSLVTYKWIAHHYAKKLIADPFIPYLQMKNEIREKFLINAILDSNPGFTCRLDDEETESGNYYFRRGELLVAIGRDANNQMYPIARAVVKGLLESVNELLPNAEHRKCTRHLFANYKKKISGVQLQCLFWNVASTTVEELYYSKMEELKIISTEAYQYLCDRNPNSWAILVQRTKPIITMLEDIRLYVMQRLVAMNRVARTWEHSITPSIRKRVEVLKEKQRDWMVIPSGFQVLEVRKGHEAYGVNIHLKQCMCRMWQLSGRPRKSRMKGQSENNSQVSRVGRKMTCTNCQETGHNKSSCKKPPVPKPKINRPSVPKPHEYGTYASARGRGRGSRGGRGGFGGRGEGTATMGDTGRSQRGRGRGQRGRGRGQRGRGRGQMQRDGKKLKREDEERLKEQLAEQEWESKMDYYHPSNWSQEEESFEVEPYKRNLTTVDANVQTQESVAANISDKGEIGSRLGDFEAKIPSEEPIAAVTPSADKGKQLVEPSEQPELQLRRSKRKAPASSEEAPAKQRIIFHKNRGRSERIFNQKMKKSGFGKDGEGSTPEKAFSLI
ncbi:hypothetical protein Tco_0704474 [Tanacetum coccineum]|uniref:PB1-like domain-containing protein n=1 Tax=Tanacetum coccineum TaxID=301880 RepID=A0ABQ4Y3F5_9ASTR